MDDDKHTRGGHRNRAHHYYGDHGNSWQVVKPKLEVDRVCDAAYLRITKKKVDLTIVLKGGVVVDYDKKGWLVGIEFLNLETLSQVINSMEVHDDSSGLGD